MSKHMLAVTGVSDSVVITPDQSAIEARDGLIAAAEYVQAITDANSLTVAVEALREIDSFLSRIEADRKTVKSPFYEYGKKIDEIAKELSLELSGQKDRLRSMIGCFQAEQDRLRREAERIAREEEEKIRREAAEAIAKAEASKKSEAVIEKKVKAIEDDAIAEIVSTRSYAAAVAIPKVAGIQTREETEIVVDDVALLWQHSPECVEFKPRMALIKAKLKAGIELPGITVTKRSVAVVSGSR